MYLCAILPEERIVALLLYPESRAQIVNVRAAGTARRHCPQTGISSWKTPFPACTTVRVYEIMR
jgi:hypothetical protein